MNYAQRVENVAPSGIRELFSRAQGIPGVISLGIGQPDIASPKKMVNKLVDLVKGGDNYYSPTPGTKAFREAVAQRYEREYNLEYNPNGEILATASGCEALYITLMAYIDPGDEVLIPDPAFLTYPRQVTLAGGKTTWMNLKEDLTIDTSNLQEYITKKTKAIILNFPSNPTGAIMTAEELKPIVDLAVDHDLFILSDEVYEKIIFTEDKHVCVPTLQGAYEKTLIINSFSKTFCVPGWRIGFIAGPKELLSPIMKVHSFVVANAPSAQQNAIASYLNTPDAEKFTKKLRNTLRERSEWLLEGFNSLDGFECKKPKGSFYLFPKVSDHKKYTTSAEFSEKIFQEQKIVLVPGSEFGPSGEGYLRASVGSISLEKIKETVNRLKQL
ncbi:MAG: aminotransferase class I/II-fold pyridoxal phosphate-dependent enzyme [Candidatus Heimdallarchaeota archaeon]|nr:aminotransferase class I/II-fold pyridoxal phosphate-dependent enzyme [Candidatus Heimdallarchaeota archaeon]